MNGFTQGGYRLVYTDRQPEWRQKEFEKADFADFSTSLGFSLGSYYSKAEGENKTIGDVWWGSPALKAGLTPGMEIVSVNGTAYTPKVLTDAVLEAEKNKQPLQLQFRKDNSFITISLSYFDGMRYPTLERVEGTPDRLDDILAPSKSPLPSM
jgi:predicted metalloprotease with PDZ domain